MWQKTFSHDHNGHRILVKFGFWGGEKVFYDGEEVASGISWTGGTYEFEVMESSSVARYEVKVESSMKTNIVTIRRNQELIKRFVNEF